MHVWPSFRSKLVLFSAFFSISALALSAQGTVRPLITQPIDETKLTVLHGNTHPLARAEFDRGAVASNLVMDHMQLVLKRSPEREAALEKLMAEQTDRSSPNYHKWLTPEQFGEQYGASDQDIQTITAWLGSHGFVIGNASKGKMTIDFSGTAGQVQQAFHTTIHRYVINEEEHLANAHDPSIPTALAPAVVGIASLHNFFPKRQSIARPAKQIRRPLYTFPTSPQCSESTSANNNNPCSYGLAPADFDKIYSVPSARNGSGETIAIVSDSDINENDVVQFRSVFGLPAENFLQVETDPATDPGNSGPDGDEVEAVLDVEWSAAVATAANIDLVVSANTAVMAGVDISAQYIVNTPLPPTGTLAPIMSVSYGLCELDLGTAGNQFHNSLWQQAASEGITVLVSAGDNGGAGCDILEINGPPTQPAEYGLEINGLASTPYNVAVGGTDFNDVNNPSTYWSTSNNAVTGQSVLSYIPEMTWNDSCTNSVIIEYFGDANAAATCNDPKVLEFSDEYDIDLVSPTGASGGVSSCTTNSTTSATSGPPSSCSGGYPKPVWQTGPGVPNDNLRDIPDLSMFSADGLISGSFYIDCEEDLNDQEAGNDIACNLAAEDFVGLGGTSAAAQVMAGIVALVDQKEGPQGNINPTLYALGSEQSPSACNSSSPGASCVFNNVTVGTIEMPCAANSASNPNLPSGQEPNCTVAGKDSVGILTGYNAGAGYSVAAGLGSVNVTNLTNSWGPNFYLSSANPTVTIPSVGSSGNLSVTLNAVNGFTGNVTLACTGLFAGDTCSFSPVSPISLTNVANSVPVTVMIQTSAARVIPAERPWGHGPSLLAVSSIVALLLGCLGLAILGSEKRWIRTAFALAAFSLAIAVAGCGGGGSSPAPPPSGQTGTTTVTLTGTSGNVTSSMTFVLTVD